jgi:hypothetical protein
MSSDDFHIVFGCFLAAVALMVIVFPRPKTMIPYPKPAAYCLVFCGSFIATEGAQTLLAPSLQLALQIAFFIAGAISCVFIVRDLISRARNARQGR